MTESREKYSYKRLFRNIFITDLHTGVDIWNIFEQVYCRYHINY